jgi:hypothetical protein
VLETGLDALPPPLVAETIEALPRHDFKNAFFTTLVETLPDPPPCATWAVRNVQAHINAVENLVIFARLAYALMTISGCQSRSAPLLFWSASPVR